MRLFTAILLDSTVKSALTEAISDLKKLSRSGSFTTPENLHLTVNFIGETNKLEYARRAIAKTRFSPFPLRLGEIGCFERSGGDIVWAGCAASSELTALYSNLYANLKAEGFVLETRKYTPHLTLGRQVVLLDGKTLRDIKFRGGSMPVAKVSLMRSDRINGRLTYTEVFSAPAAE